LKVLILDVGSYSIKALYLNKTFRGCKLNHFSHTIIQKDPKLSNYEQLTEAVKSVKKDNNYNPEQIVVIYPADKTTNRTITLPFRDKKRIELAIPIELEEQLPFSVEEAVYDWQIVENLPRGSKIIVTVTMKKDLDLFIGALKDADVDPDIITPGSDALFSLLNYLKLGKEKVETEKDGKKQTEINYHPVVVVDVGHTKSNVVISKKGIPEYTRLVNYGGDYITRRIMEEYDLTYEEAEKSKIDVGYIISEEDDSNYTQDQIKFSDLLKESYDIIIRDINQAIASYKAEKKETINHCYIAGSGWQTRNFTEYMSKELRLTIEPLHYHKTLGIDFPFAGTNDELVFINLIGFLMRYIGKVSLKGLNLRKTPKDLVKDEAQQNVIALLKPTFKNVVLGLIFFSFFMMGYYMLLDNSLSTYKDQLEQKTKLAFPDKDRRAIGSLLDSSTKLNSEIKSRMTLMKTIVEGDSSKKDTALAALMELSSALPRDVVVDVVDLEIDSKDVNIIKGFTPNQEIVKKMSSILESSPRFKDVKLGEVKNSLDGEEKEFSMKMIYQP
jgi:type IV pilus assembly protein PilM